MPLAWKMSLAGLMLAIALPSFAWANDEEFNLPDHQFSNPLFGPSATEGDNEDNRAAFIGSGRTSAGRAFDGGGTSGGTEAESAPASARLPVDERGYLMAPALFRKANEVFRQMVPPTVRIGGPIQAGAIPSRPQTPSPLFSGVPIAALGTLRPADMAAQDGPAALAIPRVPASEAPNIGTRLEADPRMSRVMSELKSSDDVVSQRQEAARREQQLKQAVSRGAMKGAAVGAFRLMEAVKK